MRNLFAAQRPLAVVCCALLALVLCDNASHAAGTNLRWDRCYGDGGVVNKDFACNTNAGGSTMVGSFELGADFPQASGIEFTVDLTAASPSLPAWWQFKNVGTCRSTALSVNFVPNAQDVVCADWSLGMAAGGIGAYTVGSLGANTATILGAIAVPPTALSDLFAGVEYFAFNLRVANTKTVGTGACSGCQTPVCVAIRRIKLTTQTSTSVILTDMAHAPNSNYVSWQQGTGIVPFQNGTCAGFDSAGFAVNVAVVGRGQVARSRTKSIYPTGSPISLFAQPFAGDRFVAWSGDTTATDDTLSFVVNSNKQFTATFDRDPAAAAVITSVTDVPGDEGSQVSVKFDRSPLDTSPSPGSGLLDLYHVERQPEANPGAPWTSAGIVAATAQSSYEVLASTPADSTALDPAQQRFRVTVHAVSDFAVAWTSSEVLGHSADNLAPPAPASVTGTLSSGFASFFWGAVNAPDLATYRVYRADSAPVPIDAAHLIASTTIAGYSDAPGHFTHYAVTALDVHGNESPATPFVPLNSAGTDGPPAPRTLTFGAPTPLPMTDQVTLSIGLPQSSHVSARILDAQGRLVLQLQDADAAAGWTTVRWDGRDHDGRVAAAGLYFMHVRTSLGERVARIVRIL